MKPGDRKLYQGQDVEVISVYDDGRVTIALPALLSVDGSENKYNTTCEVTVSENELQ